MIMDMKNFQGIIIDLSNRPLVMCKLRGNINEILLEMLRAICGICLKLGVTKDEICDLLQETYDYSNLAELPDAPDRHEIIFGATETARLKSRLEYELYIGNDKGEDTWPRV